MVLQSAKDGLSLFSAQLQTPLEPKAPLIAKFSEARDGARDTSDERTQLGKAKMF